MIKLDEVKRANLRAGELCEQMPELYALKEAVENNAWHNNENGLEHTLIVVAELHNLLRKLKHKKIGKYFEGKIGKHKRKDLLFLAALLHDLGKKATLTKQGKATICPKHERVGYRITRKMLSRFDLSPQEKNLIAAVVREHNSIHEMLGKKDFDRHFVNFKKKFKEYYRELVLLGYADTIKSYLKYTEPANYTKRIRLLRKILVGL